MFFNHCLFEDYTKKEDEKSNWTLKEILTHPNISLSVILIAFFGMLCTMNNPILEPELRAKVWDLRSSSKLVHIAIHANVLGHFESQMTNTSHFLIVE